MEKIQRKVASLYSLLKPILFSLEPERAHRLALSSLKLARPFLPLASPWLQKKHPRLEKTVFGLRFPNPIGLAAGLDKKADHVADWEKLGFGFAEIGTFTALAQPGNPRPRVFRIPSRRALINRMGFPNPGAEAAAQRLKSLREKGLWPQSPIGINLGKSKAVPLEEAAEDYLCSLELLAPYADYIAVNVSSPNTPGLRALQEAKPLKKLLTALVKAAPQKPILLKLSPDLEKKPLLQAAETALSCRCRGLIAVNTTLDRPGFTGAAPEGGLSGVPLGEKSLRVLEDLARFTRGRVPLIAVGGIFNERDARRRLEAGAELLQIYTGYIYEGPGLPSRLCRALLEPPSPLVGHS